MTETLGSLRKLLSADDRLGDEVLPSYRVKVMGACLSPLSIKSRVDVQYEKTTLE
jgi:hypothetical protein